MQEQRVTMTPIVLLIFVVYNGVLCSPDHNTRNFRNALSQQSLQTVLQSIEERLRNLDQIYATRYSSKTEPTNDLITRRLDLFETKLNRIESLIDIQLSKISENMSSKNFKDDMTKDQVFRKIDTVYERVNHKLAYMEGKLDMDILKLESKMETTITKIERLDHSISVRQADMEAEITEGVDMMENVRNNVQTIENSIVNATLQTVQDFNEKHMKAITNNIKNLMNQFEQKINGCNQTYFPNDNTNSANDSILEKFDHFEIKVINMYNELWNKSHNIENLVELSVQPINDPGKNKTGFNVQPNDRILDVFTNILQQKISELGKKLDTNFQNVILTQNLFLESCYGMQVEETQLENKISLVLEKLLDSFTNKSFLTFKEIQNVAEMIRTHDAHVYRNLNQLTNTLLKLSTKAYEDSRKFGENIVQNLTIFRHELNETGNLQFYEIMFKIQVLQDEISKLNQIDVDWFRNNTLLFDNQCEQSLINSNDIMTKHSALSGEQPIDVNLEIIPEQNQSEIVLKNFFSKIKNVMFHIKKAVLNRFNYTIVNESYENQTESNEINNSEILERHENETELRTDDKNVEINNNKDGNTEIPSSQTETANNINNYENFFNALENINDNNDVSSELVTETQDYENYEFL